MANLNELFEKATTTVRGGVRHATRLGKNAANTGIGLTKRFRGGDPKRDMDDTTLARKVETELFRGASARKGKIDVNVVDGVVWLRGEAKNAAEIKSIEAKVASIPEVDRVENLLHQPKTPAPARTKKTTTAKKKPAAAKKKFERAATNEAKKSHVSDAEPAPTDLAARREGRKAAPLGSTKEADTTSPAAATGGTTPAPAANGNGNGTSGGSGSPGS